MELHGGITAKSKGESSWCVCAVAHVAAAELTPDLRLKRQRLLETQVLASASRHLGLAPKAAHHEHRGGRGEAHSLHGRSVSLWSWVSEEMCPGTGCIFQRWPHSVPYPTCSSAVAIKRQSPIALPLGLSWPQCSLTASDIPWR